MRLNKSYSVVLDDINLGAVDETMYLLDVGKGHSTFQQQMDIAPDFNTNEKRLELFSAENDFDVITNQFSGYWKYVRDSKTYKDMISLPVDSSNSFNGVAGILGAAEPIERITSFTNEKEFEDTNKFALDLQTELPLIINLNYNAARSGNGGVMSPKSKLCIGTQRVRANNNSAYNGRYVVNQYNEEDREFENIVYQGLGQNVSTPGVNKYLFVIGNRVYLTDKDDISIECPDTAVDYHTGASRLSAQEKIAVGMPYLGRQVVIYNTKTKEYGVYTLPIEVTWSGILGKITTDYRERYALLNCSNNKWLYVDMSNPEEISEIDLPITLDSMDAFTQWALSPDGTMAAVTTNVASTPILRIIRVPDGAILYTSPNNGACDTVVWTKENKIFVNSIANAMSRYEVSGTSQAITVNAYENYLTGAGGTGRYTMHYIPEINRIIGVKATTANAQPLWYFLDTIANTIESSASTSNYIGALLSVGSNERCHIVPHNEDDNIIRVIISPTVAGAYTVVEYNKETKTTVQKTMATTVAQLVSSYARSSSPAYFANNTIVVHQVNINYLIAFDMESGRSLYTFDVNTCGTLRHLDDEHFAWEGNASSAIYRVDPETHEITEKIRHNGPALDVYLGFDGDSDINLSSD